LSARKAVVLFKHRLGHRTVFRDLIASLDAAHRNARVGGGPILMTIHQSDENCFGGANFEASVEQIALKATWRVPFENRPFELHVKIPIVSDLRSDDAFGFIDLEVGEADAVPGPVIAGAPGDLRQDLQPFSWPRDLPSLKVKPREACA
jgi:hypothetical protein